MNESRQLARFVSELKYEHLPPEVIARAKDLILDQVGIMMGVSTLPWSKIVYERSDGENYHTRGQARILPGFCGQI